MKKKSKHFITACGTYPNQILISVGGTYKEMVDYLVKEKIDITDFQEFKEHIENFTGKGDKGFEMMNEKGQILLYLKEFKDNWETYEVLLHEVCHIVQDLFDQRGMVGEKEAFAYELEYLFRNIRKLLNHLNK